MTDRRVMMIQQGARRNYIYARQLEEAGLLHSLVTDAAWAEGGSGWVARAATRGNSRRRVDGIAPSRLRASVLPNLAALSKRFLHEERAFAVIDEALALPNRLRGLNGVSVVVSYHGNGGSLLDYAKRRGAKIVTDFVITPKYLEIVRREQAHWPGWEEETTSQAVVDLYRRRMAHLVALSDVYLCPSNTVARDMADLPGFDPARVRLLPYGISGVLLKPSQPERGRVLFAGAAGLRKGIPYLAEAASILKARRPDIVIAVAGGITPAVRARAETRDLVFLGALDRQSMADEFARADVYCLPSLAEGSATSIFEALANSLPIVTTASSGSVVEDGQEGLIVPERDGAAIAAAIERIVDDRDLRGKMSAQALAAAEHFNDSAGGTAFISVIKALFDEHPALAKDV